jgi:hypothetical protein
MTRTLALLWTHPYWSLALVAAVVLGAGLRLVWVEDMEYKGDEQWTYQEVQRAREAGVLPRLGMRASVGIPNPGMSLWVFIALGMLFDIEEPTDLCRAVMLLNVAALGLLVGFALAVVAAAEREPWLWAVALYAVNPLSVLVHRKIWAPSVLPWFVVVTLIGWWYRRRFGGAFLWGLVGAVLGQIHMSGFFFGAGMAAWALLFDRQGVSWRGWLLGSAVGALGLLPWLHHLGSDGGGPVMGPRSLANVWQLRFWHHLVTDPLGLGLDDALADEFVAFLTYPKVAGHPTYLGGLMHLVIVGAAVWLVVRSARPLRPALHRLAGAVLNRTSPTALTQNAALWPYGILLTAAALPVYRHYTVLVYPFEILAWCRLALAASGGPSSLPRFGRSLLAVLCVAELLVSATFLWYIHVTEVYSGDYGIPYRVQSQPARARSR